MRNITDPRNIGPADLGETNPPEDERKSGLPGYVATQLGMWTVVILVAVVFVVVIAIYAL